MREFRHLIQVRSCRSQMLSCFVFKVEEFKATDTIGEISKSLEAITKTPEDTARMLVDIIDAAKRETHGGEFMNYDGGKMPW